MWPLPAQGTVLPEGTRAQNPAQHLRRRSRCCPYRWPALRRASNRATIAGTDRSFAGLERILKLSRLRLRGPRSAQDEFTLPPVHRPAPPRPVRHRHRRQSIAALPTAIHDVAVRRAIPTPLRHGGWNRPSRVGGVASPCIADFCNRISQPGHSELRRAPDRFSSTPKR